MWSERDEKCTQGFLKNTLVKQKYAVVDFFYTDQMCEPNPSQSLGRYVPEN